MSSNFKVPVSKPDIGSMEKSNLISAFDSTWISSTGYFVDMFEEKWAAETDSKYALSVANGTVALHLILVALGIGKGDEVIVPSLTFIATANAVHYVGAKPIFADCELSDWNISVDTIKSVVTPNTKAVICVHLYGVPCQMADLAAFCNQYDLHLIEDAAEAPFAEISGARVGSFGIAASFSFYGNKVITSGEGGAISTSDDALYNRMKLLRGQGMDPERRYYFSDIGYNYRLTNMQCAILCAQIERAPALLHRRREIFDFYRNELEGLAGVVWQQNQPNVITSPWLFTLVTSQPNSIKRDALIVKMEEVGIETRPVFLPLHTLPPYAEPASKELPNTCNIAAAGISLPTFSTITDEQLNYVSLNLQRLLLEDYS